MEDRKQESIQTEGRKEKGEGEFEDEEERKVTRMA